MKKARLFSFQVGSFNFLVELTPLGIKSLKIDNSVKTEPCKTSDFLPKEVIKLKKKLEAYLSSKEVDFTSFQLDLSDAGDFQRKVWNKVRKIKYGDVKSYKWVAERLGESSKARAVGQALKKNKLLILIPCHRIIAENGTLGGFSGGLKLKKFLLDIENIG